MYAAGLSVISEFFANPFAINNLRLRHDCGDLIVDPFDHIDRRRLRDRRDGLGRKWIAHEPVRDAGARRDFLLKVEIRHLVIRDRGQVAITGDRVALGRRPAQCGGDAEAIVCRTRRAVGVNVDDGQQGGSAMPETL